MGNPLISVIVPVFNVEKYLRICLDSIMAQTFSDFEVIMIDDGSNDHSGDICDEYTAKDARFKVTHRANGGLASARGLGFKLAVGDYVATVDSDDWVDSMHLENMLSCIEGNGADCVICAYWRNVEGKDTFIKNKPSRFDRETLVADVLNDIYHAGLWNKLFKRSILMNGSINTPRFSYFEDMFTYVSYLQFAGKAVYSDCATYHYRYNPNSLTNNKDVNLRIEMVSQMLYNLSDLYDGFTIFSHNRRLGQALCSCVNSAKICLLNDYPNDYKKYRSVLSDIMPHSFSLCDVTGLSTLCRYIALKGWGYPIGIIHLMEKKIRKHKAV